MPESSSDVSAGDDILASQYNNLRYDMLHHDHTNAYGTDLWLKNIYLAFNDEWGNSDLLLTPDGNWQHCTGAGRNISVTKTHSNSRILFIYSGVWGATNDENNYGAISSQFRVKIYNGVSTLYKYFGMNALANFERKTELSQSMTFQVNAVFFLSLGSGLWTFELEHKAGTNVTAVYNNIGDDPETEHFYSYICATEVGREDL